MQDQTSAATRASASFQATGVTATALTGTAKLNANNAQALAGVDPTDFYTGWNYNGTISTTPYSAANAIADNSYFSFTLTPSAGNQLTLATLTFDAFAATGGPEVSAIFTFSRIGLHLSVAMSYLLNPLLVPQILFLTILQPLIEITQSIFLALVR